MMTTEFINNIIKKRFFIIIIIFMAFFAYVVFVLFKLILLEEQKYRDLLVIKTNRVYKATEGERGKIYDRNGILLVGNKEVNMIAYLKALDITIEKEIEMAENISKNIELNFSKVSNDALKKLYLIKHEEELEKKVNEKIKNKYKNREITKEEYINFLYDLIEKDTIEQMPEEEKKIAYVYDLMNQGYRNAYKIIKKEEVSESEFNYIASNKETLKGFDISIRYERYYPYEDVFRSYLGNIGPIPEEDIGKMLEKGYSRDDTVGVSYLEKQYEEYLKAQHETYTLNANGLRTKLTDAKPGNDIMLSIDINFQSQVEEIVLENVINAKKQANTTLYNRSYVLVSNPETGEILAAVGQGVIEKDKAFEKVNYTTDLTTAAVTPGSIVKGASHLVGYSTGALEFGYTVNDSCIKLKNTPQKCSWKRLGKIDDLKALKYSSNYYQYLIAIKIGKGMYSYNSPLVLDSEAFNVYRNMYKQFGLGVKTGIDLPYESIGYVGNDKNMGSILDFPIGQYDTYTPVQLLQYINTFAMDGKRIAPHFLKAVYESTANPLTKILKEYEVKVLGEVDVKSEYMERAKLGLKMVLESGGTGSGYIDKAYSPAGKTGTSQTFFDTNHDGVIDSETLSTTFGGYAPSDNPTFSIVAVSPNISSRKTNFTSSVNKKISRIVSDLYFKNYH